MAIRDKNIDKGSGNANFAQNISYLRNGPQTPASQTNLEVASMRMPFAGKIVSVHGFARALSGTVSYDLQVNTTTALTGTITPSAGAQIAGTLIASPTFSAGDELRFLITTSGASTADDAGLTIVSRPNLQDE